MEDNVTRVLRLSTSSLRLGLQGSLCNHRQIIYPWLHLSVLSGPFLPAYM